MDPLPKTFAERGVGHIFDNLKTTTMQKKHQVKPYMFKEKCHPLNETDENMNSDDFQIVSPN